MVPSFTADKAPLDPGTQPNIMTQLTTIVAGHILEFRIQSRSRARNKIHMQVAATPITTILRTIRSSTFQTFLLVFAAARILLL
jgi:hypothetical protein